MQLYSPCLISFQRAVPLLLTCPGLLQLREILEKLLADDADMKQMSLTARQEAACAHQTDSVACQSSKACGLLSKCACLTGCCSGMLSLPTRSRLPRCMPA